MRTGRLSQTRALHDRVRLCAAIVVAAVAAGSVAGCRSGGDTTAADEPTPLAAASTDGFKALPKQAPSTDPKAILRRLVALHKQAPAFVSTAESDIECNFLPSKTFHQVATMCGQKEPAGIVAEVRDPAAGSTWFYGYDKQLITYYGLDRQYLRRSVSGRSVVDPPALSDYCKAQQRDGQGVFSAANLIASDGYPQEVGSVSLVGVTSLAGRPTYVLAGRFSDAWLTDLTDHLFRKNLPVKAAAFRLWIDQDTCALRRSTVQLVWEQPAQGKDHPAKEYRLASTSTTSMEVKPRLDPDSFRFVAPPGSRERVRTGS